MMNDKNNKIAPNTQRERAENFHAEICQMIRDLAGYIRSGPTPSGMHVHVIDVQGVDVAALRRQLRMSQATFSVTFGLDARLVKKWERGTRVPDRAAQTLLRVIQHNPNAVQAALAGS